MFLYVLLLPQPSVRTYSMCALSRSFVPFFLIFFFRARLSSPLQVGQVCYPHDRFFSPSYEIHEKTVTADWPLRTTLRLPPGPVFVFFFPIHRWSRAFHGLPPTTCVWPCARFGRYKTTLSVDIFFSFPTAMPVRWWWWWYFVNNKSLLFAFVKTTFSDTHFIWKNFVRFVSE